MNSSLFRQISINLFHFRDTCNVYVIRQDSQAILIDFGDGKVLSQLTELGITHVSDVLMTHHHRDQGQGLQVAVDLGVRVWVPYVEQDLFAAVDAHWQARPIFNNYDVRQDRFSLLNSIPVTGTLEDYANYQFGKYTFQVIPTPGHTVGSISLLGDIDGQRIAFTGDLIAAPGKIWSLAATQWTYNGGEGISSSILSLLNLQDRQPACLLPSHGEPMVVPSSAIQLTVDRLNELRQARAQNPRLIPFRQQPYEAILPHLLRNLTSVSNAYVLLSKSSKALYIDFGYDFVTWPLPAGTDRSSRRPWLYTLPMLKRDFGVTKIDVVLPTHYHDDHVAGINLLRRVEGTQVWAAENFADVLEQPDRYNLPCLWYDPIPVDRRLPLEQAFEWEEYTITLYALPGHTLYAVAVAFEVDNTRVLATGDQYQETTGTQYNYVYENRFRSFDYRLSAELYARLNPQLIITGHWEPLWVQPGYFETLHERGEILERLHRELLPETFADLNGTDFVARIEPYQLKVARGEGALIEVVVQNPQPEFQTAHVKLVIPAGLHVEPLEANVILAPQAIERLTFRLQVTASPIRRTRIAVDVIIGDLHFGQHAEALITVD